ncbi:hypothetical protein E3Q18_00783 [Wallemia mellicola]|nr:hypothetical protein E3Q18_00783 [Wallemia mellicola]TIC07264.1 hypothetical protein E3Q16_00581 [Wallemia mellicola]TIC19841.1 hypothetical protein E3Q13_00957 [Wallemia mellicola]
MNLRSRTRSIFKMPDFDAEIDQDGSHLLDEDQQSQIVKEIEDSNLNSNRLYRIITLSLISIQAASWVCSDIISYYLMPFSLLFQYRNRGTILNIVALLFPVPSLLNTLSGRDFITISHPALRHVPEPRSPLLGLLLSVLCLLFYRNTASTRTILAVGFSALTELWMRTTERDARELHKLKYAQKSA